MGSMKRERVLGIVALLRSLDCPVALVAASRAWASRLPNRAAPHYLQVVSEGRVTCLILQPLADLDRVFDGFEANWQPGLGWLVELNPAADSESEPLAGAG